jgi:serine/threonine protein kinase
LYDDNRTLGRFDVPEHVRGTNHFFRLRYAALGGGNGIVFAANRVQGLGGVGEECAIKVLRRTSGPRQDRFQNEIRVLRELDSPFISKFFDAGSMDVQSQSGSMNRTVPWVAMQLGART